MAKRNIIYIAGIYHSGSTLLDRSLSTVTNVTGFGEVSKGYFDGFEDLCSCGNTPVLCEFWAPLCGGHVQSHHEFYGEFCQRTGAFCGENHAIVDSSKTSPFRLFATKVKRWQGLSYWLTVPEVNLTVIHLVRSPRSWVASLRRRDGRFRKERKQSLIGNLIRSDFVRLCQWYLSHKMIERYVRKNKLKSVIVFYEDFCTRPTETINRIIQVVDSSLKHVDEIDLHSSTSHIVVGNPSRNNVNMNDRIVCDSRWESEKFTLSFNCIYYFAKFYFMKLKQRSL